MMLILVTGGSRSGKSGYALDRAGRCGEPRLFIATAQAFDEEMLRRIEAHKKARPAGWDLAEEPFDVTNALAAGLERHRTVVVDCMTLWMSNLLLRDEGFGEADAARRAESLAAAAAQAPGSTVIVVTNEVGSGIVPDNELARRFRDCAGRANQVIGRAADEVQLLVSGIAMRIKPVREGFSG
jgi:adenosylcobinamide kinase / adenosylcobinamide-phosphate guanylyltransferase